MYYGMNLLRCIEAFGIVGCHSTISEICKAALDVK